MRLMRMPRVGGPAGSVRRQSSAGLSSNIRRFVSGSCEGQELVQGDKADLVMWPALLQLVDESLNGGIACSAAENNFSRPGGQRYQQTAVEQYQAAHPLASPSNLGSLAHLKSS